DGARGIDFGGIDVAYDVAVQPDGRIVVGGRGGPGVDAAFARLTAAGQPDPSFGKGGITTLDAGGEDGVYKLRLQPDGRIVAVGSTSKGTRGLLTRVTADGAPDASFAPGGTFALGASGLTDLFAL